MISHPDLLAAYARFVPPPVVRRFRYDPSPPSIPFLERFPAAVMFADVSGFTPLTEYLAHRGPDGAEQLTRILNDFFGQLVDIVTSHGGEVVKFAGDAIVAAWPAEDLQRLPAATRQAAASGAEAQTRLHDYEVLDGRRLSLHVGIGAGEVEAMHVGGHSGRWEFVVGGPALQQMADAEHLASPGTVVLSPEARTLLGDIYRGRELSRGFLELEPVQEDLPPSPIETSLPAPGAEAALASYIPQAVLAALSAGQTEWLAELRRVTVLFIGVSGLDYTAADILDQVQRVTHTLQSILFHYEAVINQVLVDDKGTVVVAVVGLPPLGHEDDPVRGVHAAVAMAARLRELELSSAIGVTTGRVFSGPVGSATRSTYTIMGDTVNVAARLMQAADDDVLCDATTYEQASSRLRFDALPPIRVKGKSEPLAVYRPHGETQLRQRVRRMFGRERERAVLAERLLDLRAGESRILAIEGSAGMGKSRLIAELLELARGHDVTTLYGAADAVERSTPYLAFRAVFRQLFNQDQLGDAPAMRDQVMSQMAAWLSEESDADLNLVPLLNVVLAADFPENAHTAALSGRTRAENTQRLLVRLLQRAAASEHLVIIVEDAHWLDSASWDLLLRIGQDVRHVLLVAASRPMDDPPQAWRDLLALPQAEKLALAGLGAEETLPLICERLGVTRLPEPVAEFILQRAGGSPFFSEELAYALRDSRTLEIQGGTCRLADGLTTLATVAVPETLQGVITSRIDRLAPPQQLMLKSASVIGRSFRFRILQDIFPVASDKDGLSDHMDALIRYDFALMESPEPDETYIFHHVITQEVAYNQMLFAQRRQLHRSIAEWYEAHETDNLEAYLPLLAHHWCRAEVESKAVEYLEKAGQQALYGGSYHEARAFLEEAIRRNVAGQKSTEPAALLRQARHQRLLGEAHMGLGQNVEGRQHLERTLEILGRPVPGSPASVLSALLQETAVQIAHRLNPARFIAAEVNESAEAEMEAVRAHERLIEVYYLSEEHFNTMYTAIRGLNVAERLGPSPELARIYANMCIATGIIPLYKAAEAYARRAQDVASRVNKLEVSGWVAQLVGMHALGNGQLARAEKHLQEAAGIFERLGDTRHWDQSTSLLAERCQYQGQFQRSIELYEKVYEVSLQSGDLEAQHWSLTGRGLVMALMGRDPDTVVTYYEKARTLLMDEALNPLEQELYYGEMALVCVLRGDTDGARQAADRILPVLTRKPPTAMSAFEGRSALTDAYLRLWERLAPNVQGIQPRAQQAVAMLRRFASVFPVARPRATIFTGTSLWLQGRSGAATSQWRLGLKQAEATDMTYDQALAHRELGRRLKDRTHLEQAARLFERCGVVSETEQLRGLV